MGGAGAGLFGRLVSVTSSMEVSKLSESTGGLRAFCGVGRTLTLLAELVTQWFVVYSIKLPSGL